MEYQVRDDDMTTNLNLANAAATVRSAAEVCAVDSVAACAVAGGEEGSMSSEGWDD